MEIGPILLLLTETVALAWAQSMIKMFFFSLLVQLYQLFQYTISFVLSIFWLILCWECEPIQLTELDPSMASNLQTTFVLFLSHYYVVVLLGTSTIWWDQWNTPPGGVFHWWDSVYHRRLRLWWLTKKYILRNGTWHDSFCSIYMNANQSAVSKVYICIIFCCYPELTNEFISNIIDLRCIQYVSSMVPKIHRLHYDTIPNFVRAEIMKQPLIFCSSQFPHSCEYKIQIIGALLSWSCQASRTNYSFFTITIQNYFVMNSLCKKLSYTFFLYIS